MYLLLETVFFSTTGPWWYAANWITYLLNGAAPGENDQITWGKWYKEPWFTSGDRIMATLSRAEAFYKCRGE